MAYNKKPSITCRKSLASVLNTYVQSIYLCKLYIVHSVCELAEFDPPFLPLLVLPIPLILK